MYFSKPIRKSGFVFPSFASIARMTIYTITKENYDVPESMNKQEKHAALLFEQNVHPETFNEPKTLRIDVESLNNRFLEIRDVL